MSETENTASAVVKATKEAKARRAEGGVEYLHPYTREWYLVKYEDECKAAKAFMEVYGRKQKFADYVWTPTTVSKKGVEGPDQGTRFGMFMDAMRDGGFDERSGAATPAEKFEKSFSSLTPEQQLEMFAMMQAKVAALKA